jgi:hypothetical protein
MSVPTTPRGSVDLTREKAKKPKLGSNWLTPSVHQPRDCKKLQSSACSACSTVFSSKINVHNCRYCGKAVCGNCSAWTVNGNRACTSCMRKCHVSRQCGHCLCIVCGSLGDSINVTNACLTCKDTLPLPIIAIVWDYLVGNFGLIADQDLFNRIVLSFSTQELSLMQNQLKSINILDGLMICYLFDSLQPTLSPPSNQIKSFLQQTTLGSNPLSIISNYRMLQLQIEAERSEQIAEGVIDQPRPHKFPVQEWQTFCQTMMKLEGSSKVNMNARLQRLTGICSKSVVIVEESYKKRVFGFTNLSKHNGLDSDDHDASFRRGVYADLQELNEVEKRFWSNQFNRLNRIVEEVSVQLFFLFCFQEYVLT